jgi:hypothetical protein
VPLTVQRFQLRPGEHLARSGICFLNVWISAFQRDDEARRAVKKASSPLNPERG